MFHHMNPYSLHMHIPWIVFINKMFILPVTKETWIFRCLLGKRILNTQTSSWQSNYSFSDSRLPCVPIFLRKATCIHKSWKLSYSLGKKKSKFLEMPGIEPGAFHMQSERSTTELHPLAEGYSLVARSTTELYPLVAGDSQSATSLTIQIIWGWALLCWAVCPRC